MAKGAKRKAGSGVQNRPTYTRISFLYQAAALLASSRQQQNQPSAKSPVADFADGNAPENHDGQTVPSDEAGSGVSSQDKEKHDDHGQLEGMSRRLLSDLRSVSLKSQIRLSPGLKRTVCKFCDTLLVEGRSCTSAIENKSRGSMKPWADVLVITCDTCGRAKRFPVAAPRQKRRPFRDAAEENAAGYAEETTGQKTPSG